MTPLDKKQCTFFFQNITKPMCETKWVYTSGLKQNVFSNLEHTKNNSKWYGLSTRLFIEF